MCGILGTYRPKIDDLELRDFRNGLDAMQYRGPDSEGLEVYSAANGQIVLGHKRLAIIDLTDAGHQPMESHCGRYAMSYNGEIYNYLELRKDLEAEGIKFRTNSDSEVLLAAWSFWHVECLSKFDGMFAFAIFDKHEEMLYIANDPFAIKPLYYTQSETTFCFSSEIPSLLKISDTTHSFNVQATISYLLWGTHDEGEATFIEGIKRLPPGHILQYSAKHEKIVGLSQWWNPDRNVRVDLSFEQAASELRSLFLSSIARQLRSDVPIGFALSGGVDSSAIVCAVRHLDPQYDIRTFSYIASNELLNEKKWADIVNEHVGATPHYIYDDEVDFDLDASIMSQGEPFGSTSILAGYYVFNRMKNEGVVVSLDGQGADESIGGYDGYPQAIVREYWQKNQFITLALFLKGWMAWPGRGVKAATFLLGDMIVPTALRARVIQLAGYDTSPDWIDAQRLADAGVSVAPPPNCVATPTSKGRWLAERLYVAMTKIGLPRLLRYADRNSMRFSIESRVPFLSPRLAEFMLTLPAEFVVSKDGRSKNLFREAMRGIVPDAILDRRDKIGFETPELNLLIANRRKLESWLDVAGDVPFLNSREVRKTINAYLDKDIPYNTRCWRLINFYRWHSLIGSDIGWAE